MVVGEKVGSLLGSSLYSWKNRVVLALFAFFWCIWGFWTASFIIVVCIVGLRLLGKQGAQTASEDTTHGSARWANNQNLLQSDNLTLQLPCDRYLLGITKELIPLKKDQQATLMLKPAKGRNLVGVPLIVTGSKDSTAPRSDDGHVLTIAGTGAGKGVAVVKPNLMVYGGSVVVLDPKGENFIDTWKHRVRLGHRVCLVDPFNAVPANIQGDYKVQFNPLEVLQQFYLAEDHSSVYDEAASIADLIVLTTDNDAQPHFNEKAKAFIRSAILFVTYAETYQNRDQFPHNLVTVKQCILNWFSNVDAIALFIDICTKHPRLTSVAGAISMIAKEERQSVLSTVLRHTEFLDSPNVQESLSASSFSMSDLKQNKLSVYLVLPANRLKTYSRLARVWIGTLLQSLMHDTKIPRHRALFMIDEMAQLGYMEPLLQAVSLSRGYGLDLWMLFQDISQIKATYTDSWSTFFANAKYQQFFGIRDLETAKYVSERLGKGTITTATYGQTMTTTFGRNSGSSYNGEQGNSTFSSGRNTSETQGETVTVSTLGL